MNQRAARVLAASLLLVAGCDRPPQPVELAPPPAAHPPVGFVGDAGTGGGLPAGHPPIGDAGDGATGAAEPAAAVPAGPLRFSGTVRLEGELAQSEDGFVFVSVKPEGTHMPSLSRKYPVSAATVEEGGARVLAFELSEADVIAGMQPGMQHVVDAAFTPSGTVEDLRARSAPVRVAPGATGVVLVLGGE